MAILNAPYDIKAPPLWDAFTRSASLQQVIEKEKESVAETFAAGGMALAPPDETPGGKLQRIANLIKNGKPEAAADMAIKMLENNKNLPEDMKAKLRGATAYAIEDLRVSGDIDAARNLHNRLGTLTPPPAPAPGITP